ncbi:AraC family transcriptional regulator [Tomitella cavernea]|uniref:Helix-turn-helix domain-containing protein n=1 Tax=Tomitella cavernea TaxID=1387982 RepID=A0ABP9CYQ2_9ACTN|nr:helix-turn-helix domain-containing protein [Tomitella cavernea]
MDRTGYGGAEGRGGAGTGRSGAGPDGIGAGSPLSKGVVRPDRRVTMRRLGVPHDVAALARHVWIPRWDLPAGEVLAQPVLEYPGTNVVIEPAAAALYGPQRGLSTIDLRGRSWGVGILLRPAAGTILTGRHMDEVAGATHDVPSGGRLVPAVRAVMEGEPADPGPAVDTAVDEAVVSQVTEWLRQFTIDEEGLLINAIVDDVESDPTLTRVADIAARFSMGQRRLQRICWRRIGYSPKWLINRRRLQEAAAVLRDDPHVQLADMAHEFGYSDQAHFAREFAAVIGTPPGAYRAQAGG